MPVDLEALSSSRIPMRHLVKANVASVPFVVGTLLFLSALTFYYFAVLRVDYNRTALFDLDPHPDATEYFAQAKALLKDRWPSIRIDYDRPQALALVKHGLDQSLQIHALFVSADEMIAKRSRLPAIPGYEWYLLNNSLTEPAILRLAPVGTDGTAPPTG